MSYAHTIQLSSSLEAHNHVCCEQTHLYGTNKLSVYLAENFSSNPSATTVRMLDTDSKAI